MILWYRGLWVYRVHIWLEITDIPRILGSECRGLWDKDSVGVQMVWGHNLRHRFWKWFGAQMFLRHGMGGEYNLNDLWILGL